MYFYVPLRAGLLLAARMPTALAILGVALLAVHAALVLHLASLLGPLVVLASPGFGWSGLLCLCMLQWTARRLMGKGLFFTALKRR